MTATDSEDLVLALQVTVVPSHCQLGPYEDRIVGGLSLLLNTAEGTFQVLLKIMCLIKFFNFSFNC